MKKAILFVSIFSLFALFLVACTRPASTESTLQAPSPDTTGLAAFQEWKFQNERAAFDEYQQLKAEAQVQEQPKVVYKAPSKKKATASKPKPVVLPDPSDDGVVNTGGNGDGSEGSEGTNTANTGEEVAKKKGMSNAVKGAVIGAGTGAVLGAVINKKNRVVGGVIGGVLGGAVGYGIGKAKDKKEASAGDFTPLMTSN